MSVRDLILGAVLVVLVSGVELIITLRTGPKKPDKNDETPSE
ncbi:hypothetical protein [Microbispora sp. NPDC049125]